MLDLSTYMWSNTLKDPRSWAIINVALDSGIRHLAAWTAGNAGLSLAMIARACNHSLPLKRRLRIYALHDRFDVSVDERVQGTLRNWECELIPVPSVRKEILSPDEIRTKVRDRVVGLRDKWKPSEYWDVTDGWDAVGMVMYRLLAAQVIRDLRPTHIIAPLGTGNLLMGILLAVRDNQKSGFVNEDVTVVGVIPAGDNIITEIVRGRQKRPRYVKKRPPGADPLAPKIAGTYTPLLACIDEALEQGRLTYYAIDLEQQESAANILVSPAQGRRILAEPSSIAAFAALPLVADELLECRRNERVLVVNSGFGLLSENEGRFLDLNR